MTPLAEWRAARLAALTAPDGWLNLVARIDLTPGTHLVGRTQAVALPSGPDLLGTLTLGPGGASFARPGEALIGAGPQTARGMVFDQSAIAALELEVRVIGKNAAATAYRVGLDCFRVSP